MKKKKELKQLLKDKVWRNMNMLATMLKINKEII